jgi:ADP-heptose:LPS heptosyltransferase
MTLTSLAHKKILVIRMSSLGDVVLATAFLENLDPEIVVDWVIASDFAFVLRGHPRVRRLIEFDKKSGFKGWIRLLKELKSEPYGARVDLHVTLRTRLARLYYALSNGPSVPWFSISKQRIRFFAYVTLKATLPARLRPTPFWQRFARLANREAKVLNPPCYLPVIEARALDPKEILARYRLRVKKYYTMMPASRWSSKEWSAEKYVELATTLHTSVQEKESPVILLLGRESDRACQFVRDELTRRKIPFAMALNENDFTVTAILIQQSIAYVGGDTGLAHLAEAVGTPSIMIFGPTRPDLGFGPWSRQSVSIFSDVGCSPCSKDGRICYRFTDRFACLKKIDVEQVRKSVPK